MGKMITVKFSLPAVQTGTGRSQEPMNGRHGSPFSSQPPTWSSLSSLRCHIRRRSSPPRRRRRRPPPPCAHPPLSRIAQLAISHQAPLVLPQEHTAFPPRIAASESANRSRGRKIGRRIPAPCSGGARGTRLVGWWAALPCN